jgi:hypothetical protein
MIRKNIITSICYGFGSLIIAMALFAAVEPAIGFGATATSTSQFTISQTVGPEISFATPATNVTMAPALGGVTGGDATGTTQVVVFTNDHLGYQMTIQASSSVGMIGNTNPANSIPAYVPGTAGVPDFNFTVPANAARFGYTVEASTTAEATAFFKNNGTICNAGAANGLGHCWLNATTTPFFVIDTSAATVASGSTSTLKFHVKINANPAPAIPDDAYVATTTLTALAK